MKYFCACDRTWSGVRVFTISAMRAHLRPHRLSPWMKACGEAQYTQREKEKERERERERERKKKEIRRGRNKHTCGNTQMVSHKEKK